MYPKLMVYSNTHVLFSSFCFSHVCSFAWFDIILAGWTRFGLQADDLIQSVSSISPSLWISGQLSPFMMKKQMCQKGNPIMLLYFKLLLLSHSQKYNWKTRHMAKTEVKGQGNTPAVGRGGVEYLLGLNPKVHTDPSVSLTVLCLDIEE